MIPGLANIAFYQGDSFTYTFRLKDTNTGAYLDLTGWTAKAQVRKKEGDATLYAEFVTAIMDQGLVRGGVQLRLTPAVAGACPAGKWRWDVQLTDPTGDVHTFLHGDAICLGQVTV